MTKRGRAAKIPVEDRPAWVQRLIAVREGAGLSQEKLAKDSGVPQTTYGGWESGTSEPKFAEIERVAARLGVPPEAIAFGSGEPSYDGTFTGALIERYKKDEGFVAAFFRTASMLDEEGFNADLHFAVILTIRLLQEAKRGPEDASLRDRINAAVARERAEIRAQLDGVRKSRIQPRK